MLQTLQLSAQTAHHRQTALLHVSACSSKPQSDECVASVMPAWFSTITFRTRKSFIMVHFYFFQSDEMFQESVSVQGIQSETMGACGIKEPFGDRKHDEEC